MVVKKHMEDSGINVIGGASTFSGTFINSVSKLISTIFNIGRAIGSAINYSRNHFICTPK